MMNPEAQLEFDRIVSIEPAALTESDVLFLRARRSYLSEEQKAIYAEVLEEVPQAPADAEISEVPAESAPESEVAPAETPAPRSRKKAV